MKIRCELSEIVAQKGYLSTSSAMAFNSRRHDVTSIEHNVDQSWRLFICDVARLRKSRGQMFLSANEDSWSIRVHRREDVCKCKYSVVTSFLTCLSMNYRDFSVK